MSTERPRSPHLSEIEAEFRIWRREHPAATLTELEAELDRRLRQARARLLSEVVNDLPTTPQRCPECGERLVASGEHTRTLLTHDDQPLTLTRPYLRCPACGAGLFPPR